MLATNGRKSAARADATPAGQVALVQASGTTGPIGREL